MVIFLLTLIAGTVAGALVAREISRREVEALRRSFDERLKALELRPVAAAPAPSQAAAAAPPVAPPTPAPVAAPPAPAPAPVAEVSADITPDVLMVLTAAVAAFLGKKAKIRRARVAGPGYASSAWAQQGRAFVQASHNLPHR
jgi:methylmalonyl-CoA carboxyltransferase 12S subunit